MNFDADAFISYAHMDNVELAEGQKKGWVANLHSSALAEGCFGTESLD
jgi:hypothetical protein